MAIPKPSGVLAYFQEVGRSVPVRSSVDVRAIAVRQAVEELMTAFVDFGLRGIGRIRGIGLDICPVRRVALPLRLLSAEPWDVGHIDV